MRTRDVGSVLWQTAGRFSKDRGIRYGAALAFYATLSLAPLLLLAVSVISLLIRDEATERLILDQLSVILGERGAQISAQILATAPDRAHGIMDLIGTGLLLLIGGSAVFVNVKGTLNDIWNVQRRDRNVLRGLLGSRLVAFLMMLVAGGVLIVSLLLGAVAAWAAPIVERELRIGATFVTWIELGISATVITLLCAAIYRILPDVDIAWQDVWLGAGVTAVLFLIGRTAIGWYLSHAAVASRFGAASSLVAFLIWVYYCAQIFFLGAEFTQVVAERRGAPIVPSEGAVRIVRKQVEAEPVS